MYNSKFMDFGSLNVVQLFTRNIKKSNVKSQYLQRV